MAEVFTRGVDEIFSDFTLADDGTHVVLSKDSKEIKISNIN